MMSQKRIFGLSTVATLLLGAGVALYAEPGVAVFNPTQAGSTTGRISDPAPQRFEVAQAQTGGGSTLPGGASSLNEIRASPKNNIVSTTCGVELSLQRLCSAGGTRYEQRSR